MYYHMNSYRASKVTREFTPSSFYMHTPKVISESRPNIHYDPGRVRMSFM